MANENDTCKCGCGQPTTQIKWSDKNRGLIRGQYRDYVKGHFAFIQGRRKRDALMGRKEKRCGACKQIKSLDEFFNAFNKFDGKQTRCKKCSLPCTESQREYARKRRKNNPESLNILYKWIEDNPERVAVVERIKCQNRRARKLNQFIESVNPQIVYQMYGGMCGICKQFISQDDFHVDHIIPLSKGGMHGYINVQPAHPVCNMRKGSKI